MKMIGKKTVAAGVLALGAGAYSLMAAIPCGTQTAVYVNESCAKNGGGPVAGSCWVGDGYLTFICNDGSTGTFPL